MKNNKKKESDLQGVTRLVTDATIGITEVVQAMHNRIVHPPFLPSTPIQHLITNIANITYKNIKWTTKFIGNNTDKALGIFVAANKNAKTTDKNEALRAVLNGVIGDHLEKTDNPLKINMQFRFQGKVISLDKKSILKTYPKVNGKILLMIHGSCMNDIQWTRKEHNHGKKMAKELDKTPIFLHYNSGLHISTNGKIFNELLDELVLNWPVPITEITILAHSMGGLITRSALYYGDESKNKWTKHLKKVFFLGTPHHGSPLERAGNYLDAVLEAVPYAKPFARLGKIRSAGVTDLRYGNLLDEDWQHKDRFEMYGDERQFVPLPEDVACYSIAAVIGKALNSNASQLMGDNMIGIKSALGQHNDPNKTLHFKEENTFIAYENNHLDLLSNPEIYQKIKDWLVS